MQIQIQIQQQEEEKEYLHRPQGILLVIVVVCLTPRLAQVCSTTTVRASRAAKVTAFLLAVAASLAASSRFLFMFSSYFFRWYSLLPPDVDVDVPPPDKLRTTVRTPFESVVSEMMLSSFFSFTSVAALAAVGVGVVGAGFLAAVISMKECSTSIMTCNF